MPAEFWEPGMTIPISQEVPEETSTLQGGGLSQGQEKAFGFTGVDNINIIVSSFLLYYATWCHSFRKMSIYSQLR